MIFPMPDDSRGTSPLLEYGHVHTLKGRLRKYLRLMIPVAMIACLIWLGPKAWNYFGPRIRDFLAEREVRKEMAHVEELIEAPQGDVNAALSYSLNIINGRQPFPLNSTFVIQSGTINDDSGKEWTILVTESLPTISAVAWPKGTHDSKSIVKPFDLAMPRLAHRILVPTTQPKPEANIMPFEVQVDGFANRGTFSVDSGILKGAITGWYEFPPVGVGVPMGNSRRFRMEASL